MPTIRLSVQNNGPVVTVVAPHRGTLSIPSPQYRCLIRLPNVLLPKDAVVDTGAPLTWFPENVWTALRPGTDFAWLPFAAGIRPPVGRIGDWQFTYRMVRFLAPLVIMDYATEAERADVVAAFATGNPPAYRNRKTPPPIVIGLWGGLLEGSNLATTRTPAGQVAGALAFP